MLKERTEKIRWVRKLLPLFGALIIVLGAGLLWKEYRPGCELHEDASLLASAEGKSYLLEEVSTPDDKRRGLGGRSCLTEGSGMLFVYEVPGNYGIWMKDMEFAIDIVWLDNNKRVVTVKENIHPNTYPSIFYPTQQSQFIIELPAGSARRGGISLGTQLQW